MSCLIAIPCFQETDRLPPFLETLCHELTAATFPVSIVAVDDGSGADHAAEMRTIIGGFRTRFPALVAEPVFLPKNLGKGGAVYAGWATPPGTAPPPDLLCFVDADGSVPAAEVHHLIKDLLSDTSQQWDALFGSRIKMLGKDVSRLASRHYIGRVFATLSSLITGVEVYDSQCGLKVLRRTAFEAVQADLKESRFVFDVELTVKLLERGFRIREVPISWHEVPGSKVHLVRDSFRMLTGLLRIRQRTAPRAS